MSGSQALDSKKIRLCFEFMYGFCTDAPFAIEKYKSFGKYRLTEQWRDVVPSGRESFSESMSDEPD